MRRNVWHAMFAALAGFVLASSVDAAEKKSYSPVAYEEGTYVSNEIATLRAEIDSLRQQLDGATTTSYDIQGDKKAAPKKDGAPAAGGCGDCCDCCGYGGGTCGCFEPCCHPTGLWAEAEIMFLKYHRADGARVGVGADDVAEFDFEVAPRLTLGWVGTSGLGVRVRYFEYEHEALGAGYGDVLSVDTWTLDVELFDTFCLNRNWSIEVSGGIRWNDFAEVMEDGNANPYGADRLNQFDGYGGLVGLQLRRTVGCNGAVFARVRGAIMMSDKIVANTIYPNPAVELLDVTQGMVELALGTEYVSDLGCGVTFFARATAEWQNWFNYSSAFDFQTAEYAFDGSSDVGFGGFAFSIGVAR